MMGERLDTQARERECRCHFLLSINIIDPKGQYLILFFIFKTMEVQEVSHKT